MNIFLGRWYMALSASFDDKFLHKNYSIFFKMNFIFNIDSEDD